MTIDDVVEQLGPPWTAPRLSRIETRQIGIQSRDLIALLDLYQVEDQRYRAQLIEWARLANDRGWWLSYPGVVPTEYANLIVLEEESSSIRNFHPQLIPGLLQTPAYATAVIRAYRPGDTDEEIARRVAVRLSRQEIMTRRAPLTPPRLSVILEENVLRRRVGNPAVMRDQLNALTQPREGPNIVVQILPFSAGEHPAMSGPFTLFSFPDPRDPVIVNLERVTGDLILEQESEVQVFSETWNRIETMALSPADSRAMIQTYAKR